MTVRDVAEAKAELSALLVLVEGGEEVVISRAGRPIAKLTRIPPNSKARAPGALSGKIKIAEDFDLFGESLSENFLGNDKP